MGKRRRLTIANGKQAYRIADPECGCAADVTYETTMLESFRGAPRRRRRAKMVFHARQADGARFWHWSDTDVERI